MYVEFKQTATYNSHTGSKDSKVEHAVVKTVAGFLNRQGGVLLIGVSDNGQVAGLNSDFEVCSRRRDRDGFENWLYTRLADQIGGPAAASFVAISFEPIGESEICRVGVRPSPQPV
jgi:ATP-dependent Lon protease